MRNLITIIRWLVGLLFIFSGLVKANDSLGLSYKMQEFFEVWGWHFLHDYTLAFSLIMNVLEVVAGVAVIIGWRMRMVGWGLLLLIIFFTFLTGYALFSGKIKTCGCFGDCLPLTPAMSFGKDIALLVLILILLGTTRYTKPMFHNGTSIFLLIITTALTSAMQWYVLKNLPLVDCLPYKKGNDLIRQMQTPPDAIPDSFAIVFRYQKAGKELEFDQNSFPADFDDTYVYVDRTDKLVRKGNGRMAKIIDFSLINANGEDTTQAVLSTPGQYLLVFAREMDNVDSWKTIFNEVHRAFMAKGIPVAIVTAQPDKAGELFPGINILRCDATVIKTAARVQPTFFLMEGATVKEKLPAVKAKALIQ